jgi:hypothetical protein
VCLSDGSGFGLCGGEQTPDVDDCATPADEDCDGTPAMCGTGDHLFSRQYDVAFPYAVAAGAQGRIALTGGVAGPQDFGTGQLQSYGQSDIFVVVYDSNNAVTFAKVIGNSAYEQGYGIAIDGNGGVVIVGEFLNAIDFGNGPLTGDTFILRLDANGNHTWSKGIVPGIESRVWAVTLDSAGAVYLTGDVGGGVDFGGGFLPPGGSRDVFVLKLSASGDHVWSKRYGGSDLQIGEGIAVDGAGNVFVAGVFYGDIGFGGPTLSNPGSIDGFLVKLDPNGNHVWTKHFGATGDQVALAVACDAAGNVVVTGGQEGSVDYGGGALAAIGQHDLFVARYQPNGAHAWSKIFGDGADQIGWGVAVDGSSNVLVTGDFFGTMGFGGAPLTSAGDRDVFLAKLSPGGTHVWSKGFGDATPAQGLAVAADANGRVAAAGHFNGTMNFGGANLVANGLDGYLARFDP